MLHQNEVEIGSSIQKIKLVMLLHEKVKKIKSEKLMKMELLLGEMMKLETEKVTLREKISKFLQQM